MKKRQVSYEFARVISMIFVIAIHLLPGLGYDTLFRLGFSDAISPIIRISNAMFFMISGKFALSVDFEQEGAVKDYYIKKAYGLIIPVFIFMIVNTLYTALIRKDSLNVIYLLKMFIKNVIHNYTETEYWFLYTLIPLLIIAPVLAIGFHHLTNKQIGFLLGIGLLYNGIRVITLYTLYPLNADYMLGNWVLYFCLGYFLDRLKLDKQAKKYIYILAFLGLCITYFLQYKSKTIGIFDLSPFFSLLCMGAYVWFGSIDNNLFSKKMQEGILFLGKYTFPIYLVHQNTLVCIVTIMQNVQLPYLIKFIFIIILDVAASLFIGMVIERVLVRPIVQWIKKTNILNGNRPI